MADTRELKRKLVRHATRLHERAVDEIARGLDRRVPKDTGATAFSRRIVTSATESRISSEIFYPGEVPNYLDEGTKPHTITGRPLLVFFWPRVGRTVFLRRVRHPGSRKHKGWFSKWVTASRWRNELRKAQGSSG